VFRIDFTMDRDPEKSMALKLRLSSTANIFSMPPVSFFVACDGVCSKRFIRIERA
jgi:hypothetical protein